MADSKISELTALTGSNTASGDLIPIVDVSATETKSITRSELAVGLQFDPRALTSFTPTFAAGTAGFQNTDGFWYRDRNFMIGRAIAGVTTPGNADLTMTVPAGLTIDTAWILHNSTVAYNDVLGHGKWYDNAAAYRDCNAVYFGTTTVKFFYSGGSALVGSVITGSDHINVNFIFPIAEWA